MALINMEVYLQADSWADRHVLLSGAFSTKKEGAELELRQRIRETIDQHLAEHPDDLPRLRVFEWNEYIDTYLDPLSLRYLDDIEEERRQAELAAAPPEPGLFDDWNEYTRLLEEVLRHAALLTDRDVKVSTDIREQVRESLAEAVAEAKQHRLYPLFDETEAA